jgi:hypothetical protein
MNSFFAFTASPFSRTKFVAYLGGLAAIAAVSFVPLGSHPPERILLAQDGKGAPAALFDLVRFGRPADEVVESLRQAGIPWFLRRAGVTDQMDASHPGQLVITLVWNSRVVGRYIERVEPIDADRTRVYIAFEPGDMALVRRLAAPVDTTLDPQSLLRVTLAEHVRASIDGDGFRLRVLKPGAPGNQLSAIFGALAHETRRDSDDFPLDEAEQEDATIRHAYRDEAEGGGEAAPKF